MAPPPWAKHVVAATAIIAFAALVGVSAPLVFPLVGWVENRVADIRVATLSPAEPQHPDIVVVAVTEDTLAALPYRSPLDRRFLAGLLRTLEAAGVRAIGLDILLDQPTEAAKDAELRAVLKSLGVPVVVAWADSGDKLTERQAAHMSGVTIRAGAVRHLITTWWVKVSPSLTVISSNPSIFAMSKKLKVSSTLYSRKMGVARADEVNVANRARTR